MKNIIWLLLGGAALWLLSKRQPIDAGDDLNETGQTTKYAIGDKIQFSAGAGDVWQITAIDPDDVIRTGDMGSYKLASVTQSGLISWESIPFADKYYVKV